MPGNSQSGRHKQKAVGPSKTVAAQGSGTNKRTPISAFDPAAGANIYEPELICAQRLAKGVTQYQVKWAGYGERSNTWEPIENLAGCEDLIVEFKEREKIRQQKLDEEAAQKRAQKEAAKAEELKEQAEAHAQRRRAESSAETTPCKPAAEEAPAVAGGTGTRGPARGSRRTSPWWRFFSEDGAEEHHAHCVLETPGTNRICNEKIKCKEGPTGT